MEYIHIYIEREREENIIRNEQYHAIIITYWYTLTDGNNTMLMGIYNGNMMGYGVQPMLNHVKPISKLRTRNDGNWCKPPESMEWTWVNCLLKGRTVETADIRHLRCESMFHVCAWSFWSCFDIHALFGTCWNTSHGLHSFSLEPKDQERAVTEPASGQFPLLSLLHHCYIVTLS
jgi:hypothetical protein